jgi:PPOX class probable FMN-dependent enzyme
MGISMDDAPPTEHGFQDIAASKITSSKSYCQSFTTPLKPWREAIEVSIAKSRKIRGGNYVQLSTIDSETNEPRCRTVVFRGFQPLEPHNNMDSHTAATAKKPCVMKMITDARSSKVKELISSSISEMVWWFSQSSEQYRIRGRIQLVSEDTEDDYLRQARKEQWGNLSDSAREQFYWTTPGILYQEQTSIEIPQGGRDAFTGKVLPPPKDFLLMLLHPFHVDYLRLSDNYRQIDELDGDSELWNAKRVTP